MGKKRIEIALPSSRSDENPGEGIAFNRSGGLSSG